MSSSHLPTHTHTHTHAWEERWLEMRARRQCPPPHTRMGRTFMSAMRLKGPGTSPHTRGKNYCLAHDVSQQKHLPTHAWEEPTAGAVGWCPSAPPHTRVGRTNRSGMALLPPYTSPHTHGKNHTPQRRATHSPHLPTHAWEERIPVKKTRPGRAPPHTRVGRTEQTCTLNVIPRTSPHTRRKNLALEKEESAAQSCVGTLSVFN